MQKTFLGECISRFVDKISFLSKNGEHFTAVVAQLVRALDCGSKCRGFESRRSPHFKKEINLCQLFTLFS